MTTGVCRRVLRPETPAERSCSRDAVIGPARSGTRSRATCCSTGHRLSESTFICGACRRLRDQSTGCRARPSGEARAESCRSPCTGRQRARALSDRFRGGAGVQSACECHAPAGSVGPGDPPGQRRWRRCCCARSSRASRCSACSWRADGPPGGPGARSSARSRARPMFCLLRPDMHPGGAHRRKPTAKSRRAQGGAQREAAHESHPPITTRSTSSLVAAHRGLSDAQSPAQRAAADPVTNQSATATCWPSALRRRASR